MRMILKDSFALGKRSIVLRREVSKISLALRIGDQKRISESKRFILVFSQSLVVWTMMWIHQKRLRRKSKVRVI